MEHQTAMERCHTYSQAVLFFTELLRYHNSQEAFTMAVKYVFVTGGVVSTWKRHHSRFSRAAFKSAWIHSHHAEV